MTIRKHAIVHGRVQGVGFRYAAEDEANRLGLTGYVRNRSDGAVEAELEGDEASVTRMLDWLHAGPPGAHVRKVTVTDVDPHGSTEFRITW
ncbi:MAG: acylphosphatase [Microbacteriaceae bacterium]